MNEKEECEERYPLVDALIDMLDGKATTDETVVKMFKAFMGDNKDGGTENADSGKSV